MNSKNLSRGFSALAVMASAFFFSSCETTGSTSSSAGSGASSASSQVAEGRKIYFGRCTACHEPERVKDYSLAEWRGIMPEMAAESKLTAAQRNAVMAYVKSFY